MAEASSPRSALNQPLGDAPAIAMLKIPTAAVVATLPDGSEKLSTLKKKSTNDKYVNLQR